MTHDDEDFAYDQLKEIDLLNAGRTSGEGIIEPTCDEISELLSTFNNTFIQEERLSLLRIICKATKFFIIAQNFQDQNIFYHFFQCLPQSPPPEAMYIFKMFNHFAKLPGSLDFFMKIGIMPFLNDYITSLGQSLYQPKEDEIDPSLNFCMAFVQANMPLASSIIKFLGTLIRPPVEMKHVTVFPFIKVCCTLQGQGYDKLASRAFYLCDRIYRVCRPSDLTFEVHGILSLGFERLSRVDEAFPNIVSFLGDACSNKGENAFYPDDFFVTVSHLLTCDDHIVCLTFDLIRALITTPPYLHNLVKSDFGAFILTINSATSFKVKRSMIVLLSDLLADDESVEYVTQYLLSLSSLTVFVDFLALGEDIGSTVLMALNYLILETNKSYGPDVAALFVNSPDLMDELEQISVASDLYNPSDCETAMEIISLVKQHAEEQAVN